MNPELRGPAATGLLVLGILVSLAAAPGQGTGGLAAVGVGAVLFRALFALRPVRRGLQPFAEPLDLLVGTALVLTVMALTGGLRSPFALLLFVDLLLVRAALGAAAARFFTLLTLLSLGVLAGTTGLPATTDELIALAARVLWPLPVLLAMEVGLPKSRAPEPPAAERPADGRPLMREWDAEMAPSPPPEPPPAPRRVPAAPPRQRTPAGGPAEAWGAVAHDLRSPLSVIRVYADLIAEQAARGEAPRADHVRNLADEIGLMESLLVPRGEAAAIQDAAATGRVDLVRLLGALTESYRLASADRLRVEFMAERAEVPVAAETVNLQRVFRNLLDNAVKFTPPGGRVRVRVGADAGHAVVTVSDTGVGMNADERARAFEYAFRGRAARGTEGRGIGLGVSRELVEKSGGTIALASEQGQGSDVTVRLPLAGESGR